MINGQQHAMSEIPGIAVSHKAEAAVRQNHEGRAIEHAPNDPPLPWDQLVGPIDIWIAIDRAARMSRENGLLGTGDQIREAMLCLALHGRRGFRQRNGQAGGKIGGGMKEAAIGRKAADADELSSLTGQCFGNNTNAPVSRDDDVEGAPADCRIERFAKMRIGMKVLDVGTDLGNFVRAAMKNSHCVPTVAESVHKKGSAGTGAADYQSAFH